MKLIGEDISCERGGRLVLHDVSFMARPGVPLLVKGPNGAGKSTLLRLVAGLVDHQEGALRWTDDEGASLDPEIPPASYFHFIGHLDAVKPALTVRENLAFWAALYGAEADVDPALERLELDYLRDVPGQFLSAGQKRRTALARLLIGARPLWILDEPTVSLDIEGQALVARLMKDHCAGDGLLMVTTHVDIGLEAEDRLDLPRLETAWVEAV